MTQAMPTIITNEDLVVPSAFNVMEALHKMDSKLSLIKHSILHGVPELDEIELFGIATITEEVQNSLEHIMNYCRDLKD
ncbi:MAG: hypothetical protein WBB19_19925 [Desulforhopalus sp.]